MSGISGKDMAKIIGGWLVFFAIAAISSVVKDRPFGPYMIDQIPLLVLGAIYMVYIVVVGPKLRAKVDEREDRDKVRKQLIAFSVVSAIVLTIAVVIVLF